MSDSPGASERPSIGRSVVMIVLSRVAVLPLGLIQGAILARILMPVGLGRYSALLTDVNLAVAIVSLGLPGALSILAGENGTRVKALLRLALLRLVFSFVLPSLFLCLLCYQYPSLPERFGRRPGEIALICGLSTLQFLRDCLNALLLGRQLFAAQNTQAILLAFLQLLVVGSLAATALLTVETAIGVQLASHGVIITMAALALRAPLAHTPGLGKLPVPTENQDPLSLRALHIGTRNFLHILPDLLLMRVDVYLMQTLLARQTDRGQGQLGIYQAGVRLAELVLMAPSALNAVLFAKASAKEDLVQVTIAGAKLALYLGLACLLLMALVGQPVLVLFYGERFAGSFIPCLLVLLGCCALCFSGPLAGTVAGAGAYPRSVIVAQVVAVVVNIGTNLYLIPRHGAVGAAAASTLAYAVSALILAYAFSLRFSVPFWSLLRPESPLTLVRRIRGHEVGTKAGP